MVYAVGGGIEWGGRFGGGAGVEEIYIFNIIWEVVMGPRGCEWCRGGGGVMWGWLCGWVAGRIAGWREGLEGNGR